MAEMFGFKIITQYEQGLVFRWGKTLPGIRQPGLTWVNPVTDRLRKVNMQIIVAAVPGQEAITRDNVTVKVDAVVYYRVVDPVKAIINVQNYAFAMSQVAQTSLRSVIGQSDMDQLLSERDKVNAQLKDVIDGPTEGPWGIRVERVEVKDISLPESMKRSMSRQAEAERERRARIISADGEYQASKKLAQAASVMSADPAALQLRLLQTVVEVAAENNSTLILPVPVELLRFFDRAARPRAQARPPAAEAATTDSLPPPAPAAALPVPAAALPAPAAALPVPAAQRSLPAATVLTAPLNAAPKVPASRVTGPGPGTRRGRRLCLAQRLTPSACSSPAMLNVMVA
jgi:regulator of protease activity HflC (stomatin/prohibitin superfamily)